jgi:putative ABC transport system permease protein
MEMLKNYIFIAIRNLLKHKFISIVNIIGLATSMSVGLFVLSMAKNAFDVDSFHPHPDRTYRIITKQFIKSGDSDYFATSPYLLAHHLKEHYSSIERVTRVVTDVNESVKTQVNNEEFETENVFADPDFFQIFGFKLETGDPLHALSKPYTAILSKDAAHRLFGSTNPVGKPLSFGKYGDFTVTGVMQKPEFSSRMEYDVYLSMATLPSLMQSGSIDIPTGWGDIYSTQTYVVTNEDTTPDELDRILTEADGYTMKHAVLHETVDHRNFIAQSLRDLVYSPTLYFESRNARTIPYIPLIISLLMLLLAAFNYMNLTIAKIFSRVKEIGIRKISGATKIHLIHQFITEALLIALISFGLALFLTDLIPLTSNLAREVNQTPDLTLFTVFFVFALLTGFVCGIFPSIALSKVKLTTALKNKITQGEVRTPVWQKALITIQFSVSLLFITVSLVMIGQTRYISRADYGVNRSNILNITMPPVDIAYFKNALEQETTVEQVAASSGRPVFSQPLYCRVYNHPDSIDAIYFAADENFIPVYGLTLLAGTNFSDRMQGRHETTVLINEEAAYHLKYKTPLDAIGQSITIDSLSLKITGVIKNFHVQGLKQPIKPFLLRYIPEKFSTLTLKTKSGEMNGTLQKVQQLSGAAKRDYPLEYSIFENDFHSNNFIKLDDFKMISFLSCITVLISSLGLIGIVMFHAKARASEIGIRKVMGANTRQITILISRKFILLLLLACCLALPVCYITCESILQEYAYRIQPGLLLHAIGVVILLLIGLAVICSQTIYAALRNPIEVIRSE